MFNPIDAMDNAKNKVCDELSAFKDDLLPMGKELLPMAKQYLDKGVKAAGEKLGLPNLSIEGATQTAKETIQNLEHAAGKIGVVTADPGKAFETAKNIPMEDWKEMGKDALKVLEKHGANIAADAVVIACTDGGDVVKDVKLGVDVIDLVTSQETKDLAKSVEKAYADGEKAKAAKA
jgi:hypothetical protein